MNKAQFLAALEKKLSMLSPADIEQSLAFYAEMIEDRIEEGMCEEEAVAELGSVEEISARILSETPLPKLVKARIKPTRSLRAWEILLLILGFPLWFPLLLAAAILVCSLFIVIWSVAVSLWAAEISLAVSGAALLAVGLLWLFVDPPALSFLFLGSALALAGLSIFGFLGMLYLTKAVIRLCKALHHSIKSFFIKKEATA